MCRLKEIHLGRRQAVLFVLKQLICGYTWYASCFYVFTDFRRVWGKTFEVQSIISLCLTDQNSYWLHTWLAPMSAWLNSLCSSYNLRVRLRSSSHDRPRQQILLGVSQSTCILVVFMPLEDQIWRMSHICVLFTSERQGRGEDVMVEWEADGVRWSCWHGVKTDFCAL